MYLIDPLGNATLTPAERARILGGEVCSWDPFQDGTNYLANAFPRAYAIAERLWSPQNTRDVPTPLNY
jgi:hexosaminidase